MVVVGACNAGASEVAVPVAKGHIQRSQGQSRRRRPWMIHRQTTPHAEGVP